MTVLEDIEVFLINKTPRPFCDDCISRLLKITPRQQVNQKTRKLEKLWSFDRRKDTCSSCLESKKVIKHVSKG